MIKEYFWKTVPPPVHRWINQWKKRLSSDTSQGGEVSVLQRLIKSDFSRFLVDVGANDGRHLSNARPFAKAGWRSILVEPLPKAFELLASTYKDYPQVTCLNKACSDHSGTASFFLGTDGEKGLLSTLSTDQNRWFERHRSNVSIQVEVDTLSNILAAANYPQDFTLLLVDAEGMDYEVLRGLDFSLYRPRIIVTEEYPWMRPSTSASINCSGRAATRFSKRSVAIPFGRGTGCFRRSASSPAASAEGRPGLFSRRFQVFI